MDTVYNHVLIEISKGMPLYEVMEKYPSTFLRYHAALSRMCARYDKPRPFKDATVILFWGVTNSGKSHLAYALYPKAYRKTIRGKFWDGYAGEDTVIFEEFNPRLKDEMDLGLLLKILDKYPMNVEVKGAALQLKANTFIFTTNVDPREWYMGDPQQAAFVRRVNAVYVFPYEFDPLIQEEPVYYKAILHLNNSSKLVELKKINDPLQDRIDFLEQETQAELVAQTVEGLSEFDLADDYQSPPAEPVSQEPSLEDLWCDEELPASPPQSIVTVDGKPYPLDEVFPPDPSSKDLAKKIFWRNRGANMKNKK